MVTNKSLKITGAALLLVSLMIPCPPSYANVPDLVTENGFISGTMTIDFGTRKNTDTSGSYVEGSPAKDSQDTYAFNLNVAKTTEYSGNITRKPRLVSRLLGREEQAAQLVYNVNLAVRNPKDLEQKKSVGKWVGTVAIDKSGLYDFGTGSATASQLRMAIDAIGKAKAFTGAFGGRIRGKGEEKKGLLADKLNEYTRLVKGKKVTVQAKNVDPLRFEGLVLGEGPAEIYPRTTVNGNLDYDYETGNWYTNGIRFKYNYSGVETEDMVTGSIKWVEDTNRGDNGKGQYEFNLRFNEDKNAPATDESAAFSESTNADEEAFFAVDNTVPAMTGTVSFVDTMTPGASEDEPVVTRSEVVYNLNTNKLTKQQAVNFFKLWMVIVGPTNDE